MSGTWTERGLAIDGAWANQRLFARRRYWQPATEQQALDARAVEQAEIRRYFMIDRGRVVAPQVAA